MKPETKDSKKERRGRLLTVLLIDDQKPSSLLAGDAIYRRHFDIQCISRWAEAQEWLQSGRPARGADLLLVDVGWLDDPKLSRIIRVQPESPVQPVGPLLALPFIGLRPIMACSVYSAHLTNQMLRQHPFFLLAMGLLAARTDGVAQGVFQSKHLSEETDASSQSLDTFIEGLSQEGGGNAIGALRFALGDYRKRLTNEVNRLEESQFNLTNREELTIRLNKLVVDVGSGKNVIADDTLYLGVVGPGWRESISLRSLFADELEWGACTQLTEAWANVVLDWLSTFKLDAVGMALEVVNAQDQELFNGPVEEPLTRAEARSLVLKMFGHLEKSDSTEVLRYVVLFANVWAREEYPTFAQASVLDRLGDDVQLNTYLQIFGHRSSGQVSRTAFNYLRPLSITEDREKGIWLEPGSAVSAADFRAIQRYCAAEGFALDASLYPVADVNG